VSFAAPGALWALLIIPLLIYLERRRQRPRVLEWPSLLLWRALGEDLGERKRSLDPLLLLECAAVLLLTLAASGLSVEGGRGGRTVVVHLETGPRTGAVLTDGRTVLEATRAELDRIRDALAPEDKWIVHEMERVDAPPASGDIRILATNRHDVSGEGLIVVGFAPSLPNIGIAAVEGDGMGTGLALQRDGGAGSVGVLFTGAHTKSDMIRAGEWVRLDRMREIKIQQNNCYPGDDFVRLRSVELKCRLDSESPLLQAALSVGLPAKIQEPADFIVVTTGGTPIPERVRGADCIAERGRGAGGIAERGRGAGGIAERGRGAGGIAERGRGAGGIAGLGLFDDLFLDECRWSGVRGVREPGLLRWGEWTLARWVDERTLWIGLPVDREWDDYGTLALLIERAKRARATALLAPGEALVGDQIASPAPHFVDTRGIDRPWDGTLPDAAPSGEGRFDLRALLASAGVLVLGAYLLRLGR